MPIKWTREQEDIALQLMEARATDAEFWDKLGRSLANVRSHISQMKHDRNKRKLEDRRSPCDYRIVGGRLPSIDHELLVKLRQEAEERQNAPRSIIQIVCGDPAPGQSALDKKKRSCGV